MIYRYIILIAGLFMFQELAAQNTFPEILKQIEDNNKSLETARLEKEAQSIAAKTGLLPENPTVSYGYYPGSNSIMGTKKVYNISQQIEFPTKYVSQFKKAGVNQELSQYEYLLQRQETLMETQLFLCEYVYVSKSVSEYEKRKLNAEKLNQLYEKQLELGNVSIIEANKIKLMLLMLSTKYVKAKQNMDLIEAKLIALNGGKELEINALDYIQPAVNPFDELKNTYLSKHPEIKIQSLNTELAAYNMSISRQGWLPDFLIGYQSEADPNGSYSGFQAGISIPLWNNAKQSKTAKAYSMSSESKYQEVEFRLISDLEAKYNQSQELKTILASFEESLTATSNLDFLNKALDGGEFSIIEYINELSYNYELIDLYLEIQKDYHKLLTEINAVSL